MQEHIEQQVRIALSDGYSAAIEAVKTLGSFRDPAALEALMRISEKAGSKAVRKEARKAIWKLKSAGVRVPEKSPEVRQAPGTAAMPAGYLGEGRLVETGAGATLEDVSDTEERQQGLPALSEEQSEAPDDGNMPWKDITQAYLSAVDGAGYRLAVTITPGPFGALRTGMFVLGDTEGIHGCGERSVTGGDLEDFVAEISRGGIIVKVPPKVAAFEIFRHEDISRSLKKSLPFDYFAIRPAGKDEMPRDTEAAIYRVVDAREVKWNPLLLERSAALLSEDAFSSWIIPKEEVSEYIEDLDASESSMIIVGVKSKEEQRKNIIDSALDGFFSADRRKLYKRRLEEQAFILFLIEKPPIAKVALAAAMGLDPDSGVWVQNHPFARALMELSLEVHRGLNKDKGLLLEKATALRLKEGDVRLSYDESKTTTEEHHMPRIWTPGSSRRR